MAFIIIAAYAEDPLEQQLDKQAEIAYAEVA